MKSKNVNGSKASHNSQKQREGPRNGNKSSTDSSSTNNKKKTSNGACSSLTKGSSKDSHSAKAAATSSGHDGRPGLAPQRKRSSSAPMRDLLAALHSLDKALLAVQLERRLFGAFDDSALSDGPGSRQLAELQRRLLELEKEKEERLSRIDILNKEKQMRNENLADAIARNKALEMERDEMKSLLAKERAEANKASMLSRELETLIRERDEATSQVSRLRKELTKAEEKKDKYKKKYFDLKNESRAINDCSENET